jgi:hypothetical protein
LLIGFRPAARNVEQNKGTQQSSNPLSRLGADAFDFEKVAVEFAAVEIGYDFVVSHDYLN